MAVVTGALLDRVTQEARRPPVRPGAAGPLIETSLRQRLVHKGAVVGAESSMGTTVAELGVGAAWDCVQNMPPGGASSVFRRPHERLPGPIESWPIEDHDPGLVVGSVARGAPKVAPAKAEAPTPDEPENAITCSD